MILSAPSELLKGNAAMLILSCLASKPLHGYGIVKELEARSEYYFQMKEGTLYPHLHRLEEDGLIEGYWEQQSGNRERRVYEITNKGRGELKRLQAEWQNFAIKMNKVVDLPSGA